MYICKLVITAASPKRQLGMPGVSSAICRTALEPFVVTLEPLARTAGGSRTLPEFWRFRERFTANMFVGSAPAFAFGVKEYIYIYIYIYGSVRGSP